MDAIIFLYFGSMAAILILCAVVLFRGFSSRINRAFSIINLLIVFWLYCAYMANYHFLADTEEIFFWAKMCYAAIIAMPSLFLYFASIFPENTRTKFKDFLLIFIPVPVLWALLFYDAIIKSVLFLHSQSVVQISFTPIAFAFIVYFLVFLLIAFSILHKKYKNLKGVLRMQSQYVLIGGAVMFLIVSCTNVILPLFNTTYGWHVLHIIEPLTSVFFVAMISSAIVRHPFMGVNAILGKGIVYSILAGSVTAMYFGFLYFIARFFQGINGNYSLLIGLFFFFFFAVVFEPLRDRLQELVDRTFFKSRFDYEKTLKETSSAMSVLTDRDRILKLTARLIIRRMKLTGVAIFLFDEEHDRFVVKGAEGACKNMAGFTMSSNYPLIEYLEESKSYILKSEIENRLLDIFLSEEDKKKNEDVLSDLSKLDVSLCVPSRMKNKMAAFIALGNKLSGDMFNKDDLNFLATLANQSGIFLENTKLLEREKESAKIMAEAETREKYTAMLENINKELVETREQLVKAERLTTVTKMTISLQHEINNPLTSVLVQTQALLLKMQQGAGIPLDYVKERLTTVEREARRIRELLRNLANITEPVSQEYVPGEEMIDIKASSQDITTEDTKITS